MDVQLKCGLLDVCAFGVALAGIILTCSSNVLPGTAMIGAGIVCAGVSVFTFLGCRAATKAIVLLTNKLELWIKNRFIRKGAAPATCF